MASNNEFCYTRPRQASQANILIAQCGGCHLNLYMTANMTDLERMRAEKEHQEDCAARNQYSKPPMMLSANDNSLCTFGPSRFKPSNCSCPILFFGASAEWRDAGPIYDDQANESDDEEFTQYKLRQVTDWCTGGAQSAGNQQTLNKPTQDLGFGRPPNGSQGQHTGQRR